MSREQVKDALRWSAHNRMIRANYYRASAAPSIQRKHVDGPVLTSLDGQPIWLSLWERLLTKLGVWDAWDIERRHFPLLQADPQP